MELQADRTEVASTGPSEVAEPLCAASLRCAVRCASLQEIAETVSRALAYLTDRLIWPYFLPLMAERCLKLHEEIEWAHEAYMRCTERSAANRILYDLHDRLTRLLCDSLLDERDHIPRAMDRDFRCAGEIIPVQEWMTIAGMTQPLAQRCERNGSIVSKETVVETVRRNLAELNDEHGLSGGVTRPSEPGPTVVANEAAHHQADADAASARGPSASDLTIVGQATGTTLIAGSRTLITVTTTMMSTTAVMMASGMTKRPGARVQLQLLLQQLVTLSLLRHHPC